MNKGKFGSGNKHVFEKGKTNKKPQPFWGKSWLEKEFFAKSANQIAKELSVSIKTIYFWLDKHNIERKKPTGFVMKYWWDGKQFSITLENNGKKVNSVKFDEQITQ